MIDFNIPLIALLLLGINTIINIFISFLNKDFRSGNYTHQLAQLKGLWLIFYLLPFFIFNKLIKNLVIEERNQIKENRLKENIRKKNLNNRNRRR